MPTDESVASTTVSNAHQDQTSTVSECIALQPPFEFATSAELLSSTRDQDETALVREFNVEGASADKILGFDVAIDRDIEDHDGLEDGSDMFEAFQTTVRVAVAKRAEGNRRAGGQQTQQAMVKAWKVCISYVVVQFFIFFTYCVIRNLQIVIGCLEKSKMKLLMSIHCSFSSNIPQNGQNKIAVAQTYWGHSLVL